ncbi:MAG: hypothetical protein PHQ17_09250 [Methanobacterium sp.]|nr:hypothetical protein [Methanobacterium sp.]
MEKRKFLTVKKEIKKSETGCSDSYEAKSWSELSSEYSVAMYIVIPGTQKPIDLPSVSVGLSGLVGKVNVRPVFGLHEIEHEIRPEYVSKIQKRMKNIPIKIDDLDSLLIGE